MLTAILLAAAMASPVQAGAAPSDLPAGPPPGHDMAGQFRFEDAVMDALAKIPEGVVDFSWHSTSGLLAVKAKYVESAKSIVAAHGAAASVSEARPSALPYNDRDRVQMETLDRFKGLTRTANARYDPPTDTMQITLRTDAPRAVEGKVAEVLSSRATTQSGARISVTYVPEDMAPVLQAVGGKAYSSCTGGFIGVRDQAWGIITAAHCTTKPSSYDGGATGTTSVAANYDLRFTGMASGVRTNKFQSVAGGTTSVTSVGLPVVGGFLYKYGIQTGQGGAFVAQDLGCDQTDIGYRCGLFVTDATITQSGDSGGPWWAGNRAYGIHHGLWPRANYHSVFTAVVHVTNIPGWVQVNVIP